MAGTTWKGVKVVAIRNFDPLENNDSFLTQEQLKDAPNVQNQMFFRKGQCFEILTKSVKCWWLYVRCPSSRKEGFIPSVCVIPLREDLQGETLHFLVNGGEVLASMVNQHHNCNFFPKTPSQADLHAKEMAESIRKPCPERKANLFSRLTFWWLNKLIITGFKRPLQDSDLWSLDENNMADHIVPKLQREWEKELKKCRRNQRGSTDSVEQESEQMHLQSSDVSFAGKEPLKCQASLVKAITRVFGPYFVISVFFKLIYVVLMFVQPYLLGLLIEYAENKGNDANSWKGYVYVVSMVVVATCQVLASQQAIHISFTTAMRVHASIIGAVYAKSLSLSQMSRRISTAGETMNLMTVDAQRVVTLVETFNQLWSAPLQICVAVYFLYVTMGVAVMAGLVKQLKNSDERIKLMNEVLSGIKVLKLYAWEESFISKITAIRNKELQYIAKSLYLNAGVSFTFICAPLLVSLSTFSVYVLLGNELTAGKAFVAISLFNILRLPLTLLPRVVVNFIQAQVSNHRLEEFLKLGELQPGNVIRNMPTHCSNVAVHIENGSFCWDRSEGVPILRNVSVNIPKGSLVAVVGQVGCGKSTLLSALLGETEKLDGKVYLKGSTAFVPQEAWIQNATLRQNVLFCQSLDLERYHHVLTACALDPDIKNLPAGDLTEIGEKGVNLSGGQKQRVSLARAVYFNADIYFLDDPLSAVDSHVGKHIFDKVIGPEGLLREKTRIFVTHAVQYLPHVDQIIVLQDGVVAEYRYHATKSHDEAHLTRLRMENKAAKHLSSKTLQRPNKHDSVSSLGSLNSYLSICEGLDAECLREGEDVFSDDIAEGNDRLLLQASSTVRQRQSLISGFSLNSLLSLVEADGHVNSRLTSGDNPTNSLDFFEESVDSEDKVLNVNESRERIESWDKRKEGRTSGRTTTEESMGILCALIILLSGFGAESSAIASRIWLAKWSSTNVSTSKQRDTFLGFYALMGVGQVVLVTAMNLTLAYSALKAGRHLHQGILINVMHLPMQFFESSPLGRIMNRFSKDVNSVDERIPRSLVMFLRTFLASLGTVFVISYSTPLFLTCVLPLGALYVFIQRLYISSSRQLRRIESVNRSPIYNHFFETLTGTSTIRAFSQQQRFIMENHRRLDEAHVAHYPGICAFRWLAVRLEFIGASILFFAALFAVIARDTIAPGLVGLSVAYALQITGVLNWMVRQSSELETNIVAVERIKEYSMLTREADWIVPSHRPPEEWPHQGKIEIENFELRYRENLPRTLKNLSCFIGKEEKIGIVGRTGAGKSTLTLALFRILERAGGRIVIDGIDISQIGLQDLRSRLTIIPQDPVLFSGSLRMNLDPFDKHTDEQLWSALEVTHLKNFVIGLEKGLQHHILRAGENMSAGQRQLVCLARALLRKSKVLVLDEATAAVDLETDELIQQTIRREFADRTVLTVAHRLITIMDYDRIMVLRDGSVAEFGSPSELLSQRGVFFIMARDAGLKKKICETLFTISLKRQGVLPIHRSLLPKWSRPIFLAFILVFLIQKDEY
ncbi:Multidrug resistance-associated protein 1 [Acropora cervicornis]|uniref:ABC-type glutathione-S-conjugate transporter n=1 Tax=Acropora cervicornis TaxID=6130 RepID=A0AAD9VA00_ACRCE|nr:Multidrug resistance-associated protein 1 [Acropora cervicornis]